MSSPTTTDAALARPARTERPDRTAAARADRPARPASRPHGQWKVDGTEPLNANEVWKQEDGGLAVRLGAWVAPEQVPDVWLGVTSIFRDYGYRRRGT